jgi:hypothetical protein
MVNRGFTPYHNRITDIDKPSKQGVDGIFEKDGMFYIVESKCCNGTNNKLKRKPLDDGSYQMDERWIEERINELKVSPEVKRQILAHYTPVLARVTEKGTITYSKIVHNFGARPSIPRGDASIVTAINGGG